MNENIYFLKLFPCPLKIRIDNNLLLVITVIIQLTPHFSLPRNNYWENEWKIYFTKACDKI